MPPRISTDEDVPFVTPLSGEMVSVLAASCTGPDSSSEPFETPLLAAVVIRASPDSVTVPESVAVRSDVLNDPLIAPCVPLAVRPLPAIVNAFASVVPFRTATDPLPLTVTDPVPKALSLDPSSGPFAAVRTCPPLTTVPPV